MKKKIFLILKVIVSLSIITLIFYNYISVDEFIQAVKNTNYIWLPFLILLVYLTRLSVAYQTKISLIPFNIQTNTFDVFKIHLISTFYSLILSSDLIAGGVSWYLLSKDNGKRAQIASVIVYLRILNLITLLPFALLGIFLEPRLKVYHIQFYVLVMGLLLLIMLLPFFWRRLTLLTELTLNYLISFIPIPKLSKRLLEANDNVWHSVKISQAMPLNFTLKIVMLSLLSQILAIIFMYYTLEMVNIHLPVSVAAWLLALVAIIAMLPLTIGGIGVRDISFVFILKELYGVSAEASLLVSTVILLIGSIFFGAILGGYYAMTFTSVHK